jgi:hypothetical protein
MARNEGGKATAASNSASQSAREGPPTPWLRRTDRRPPRAEPAALVLSARGETGWETVERIIAATFKSYWLSTAVVTTRRRTTVPSTVISLRWRPAIFSSYEQPTCVVPLRSSSAVNEWSRRLRVTW